MDANLALIAAQQSYNQAKTDEERAAAQQQLDQAVRARDEAHAAYQALVDEQWTRFFETEVTAFKRELEVWRALGQPNTDAWPLDAKECADGENYLLSLSADRLRKTIAPAYLDRFKELVEVQIPGVGSLEFEPTNLP